MPGICRASILLAQRGGSANKSELKINEAHTLIELKVDTQYGSVMDYFSIFMERMMLCRKAAQVLGLDFKLTINEQQMI